MEILRGIPNSRLNKSSSFQYGLFSASYGLRPKLRKCITRYGYRDVHQDVDTFESELVGGLADFVRYDWVWTHGIDPYIEDVGSWYGESSSEIWNWPCHMHYIPHVSTHIRWGY